MSGVSQIIKEIKKHDLAKNKISSDDFIKNNNLKLHTSNELPNCVYFGTTYLIDENTIIKLYSYMTNDDENIYFFKHEIPFYYKCIITFVKVPNKNRMPTTKNNIISFSIAETEQYVNCLLKQKYKIYTLQ